MIKKITALETFLVRHPVLRAGKNVESCRFDGDNLETTKHFGFYDHDKLVGVASVYEFKNNNFSETKQLQLRGMSVLKNYQKQRIGQKLLIHCEKYAIQCNIKLIWFNARINAVPFYEKLGYSVFGNEFYISEIGVHFNMIKRFNVKS